MISALMPAMSAPVAVRAQMPKTDWLKAGSPAIDSMEA